MPVSWDAVSTAAYFSRVVYGGEVGSPFDFRGQAGWNIVTDASSSFFSASGLYTKGASDGMIAVRDDTLVLAFRGTDSVLASLTGEAFFGIGQAIAYQNFAQLIQTAFEYAKDPSKGISHIVVTGHSLGGAMADIFTLVDGARFDALAGSDLSVVSLASSGVDPDVEDWLTLDPTMFNIVGDQMLLTHPSYYLGINHFHDRVAYPFRAGQDEPGDWEAYTPVWELLHNSHFAATSLLLPNLTNDDVDYRRLIGPDNGFGAEHNIGIYYENLTALANSPLAAFYSGQNLIFGTSIYTWAPGYTGPGPDDAGVSLALMGTSGNDFIFGLAGRDDIFGMNGDDLIDGGPGSDLLYGGLGNDRLAGGGGSDVLNGGAGKDFLWGGKQNDFFVISTIPTIDQIDEIKDYNSGDSNNGSFRAGEGDTIDLSALVGAAYAGGAGKPVAELVRATVIAATGKIALQVDQDGSGAAFGWKTVAILNHLAAGSLINLKLDPASTAADEVIAVPNQAGSWRVTQSAKSILEGTGASIAFIVHRPDDSAEQTVYFSTTYNKGYLNAGDYNGLLNQPNTFAVGQDTISVTVNILNDSAAESVEVFGFIVQSSPDQLASEYLAAATFTIEDDDQTVGGGPTAGDDNVLIVPTVADQYFDGGAGDDRVTLDYSGVSSGSTFRQYSGTQGISYKGDYRLTVFISNTENIGFIGGSGADNVDTSFLAGNDLLIGGGGKDTLNAGAGVDVVSGGSGDDTITVGAGGPDVVDGGAGVDHLRLNRSDSSEDFVFDIGAEGTSTLVDGTTISGFELLDFTGGSGDDDVTYRVPTDGNTEQYFDGGVGDDRVTLDYSGFSSGSTLRQYSGTQGISYNGDYRLTVYISNTENIGFIGGSGADNIDTSFLTGNDLLIGGGGKDTLNAGAGVDVVSGGSGDDTIYLGAGRDRASGDNGNDKIFGGAGVDRVSGGAGQDILEGNGGADRLNGNGGADTLDGGTGADTLNGGGDDDLLRGKGGADVLKGGAGYDELFGGNGNDILNGGGGSDHLDGGKGADRLIGGKGDDRLEGGGGSDVFFFVRGCGSDSIIDFQNGRDVIEISRGASGFDDINVTASGTDTIISFSNVSVLLTGVDSHLIGAEDFVFV